MKFPDVSAFFSPFSASKPRTPSSTPGISGHGLQNGEVSREINYAARLTVCATTSFVGLQLLAWADNVGVRMLGIALASLSSNLGDMQVLIGFDTRRPVISDSFQKGLSISWPHDILP